MRRILCTAIAMAFAAANARASDGALDSSFGNYLPGFSRVAFDLTTNGDDRAVAVLVQPNGGIVLVGNATTSSGSTIAVTRLLPDGGLDTNFGTGGKLHFSVAGRSIVANSAALQGDGRIVIGGGSYNVSNEDFLVCRVTAAGALDATFAGGCTSVAFDLDPTFNQDSAAAVLVQPNGAIVLAGFAQTNTGFLSAFARQLSNGMPDPTFGLGGTGRQVSNRLGELAGSNYGGGMSALALQSDGKLVAAGSVLSISTGSHAGLLRLDTAGQLDTTYGSSGGVLVDFGSPSGFSGIARAAADHMVAAGSAFGPAAYAVAGLDSTGALDSSFNGTGKFTLASSDLSASCGIVRQSDGRLVIASTPNTSGTWSAIRLTAAGVLDAKFGTGGVVTMTSSPNFLAQAITLENGRPILAGYISYSSSGSDFMAVRLVNDDIFFDGFER